MGIINRMERDGLIKRLTNSKNKKYTRVFLTEEKQALYKKALDLNAFTSIFSNLSGEERQNLKKYLDSLKNKAQSVVEEKHNNKRKK